MRILIALDGSDAGGAGLAATALAALGPFALVAAAPPHVHLAAVLPPPTLTVPHPSPVATAAAVAEVLAAQQQQARADELRAEEALEAGARACAKAGVPEAAISRHVLPASGGASGVAQSIVEFVRSSGDVDLVVAGSRGLGSLQRSLMSFVGLGSVSDYLSHNLAVPLMVVRPAAAPQQPNGGAAAGAEAAAPPSKGRTVVVALDDSPHSALALEWALSARLAAPAADELHCVAVAQAVPYPILDEASAAVAVLEAQQWQSSSERNSAAAKALAARAAAAAGEGGARVVAAALEPEGGASDVGAALVKYAGQVKADLVVLGSRGMGAVRRSLMSFMGLGSVSDYALHNLACPVIVVKAAEGTLPAKASGAAGAAAAATAAAPAGPPKDD